MNAWQIAAFGILLVFYLAYFTKMFLQKHKGIQTHQIHRGTKSSRARRVERIMGFATLSIVLMEFVSILFDWRLLPVFPWQPMGLGLAALGVCLFIAAMVTMRDSWRAGINERERTQLVTGGIYTLSRNPAFLGFDLVYAGLLLAFFNLPLLLFTVLAAVSLHLQILQEEMFLQTRFGAVYAAYRTRVGRYFLFF